MSTSEIDELLQRAVDNRVLPGVVALTGDRDGARYEGAFGLLNIDGDAPVEPDTMFAIMSMTKAFTSVAALQLIEQGAIELATPVADVLPAFADLRCSRASTATLRGCVRPRAGRRTPPAHAHVGSCVLVHQRRHPALPPADRNP